MARLTRKQLAQVFPNHELIKAFEQIDESTDSTLPTQIAQAQLTADNALDLATAQALGVLEPRQQTLSLRAGDGVDVTPDAAGFVFSINLGFMVNAAKAFLSHTFQVTAEAIRYALGYTPAPTDSPAFTGTPTAPTAAAGTNTTQIATTAHVFAERTNAATLTNKTIALGSNTVSGTLAQFNTAVTDADFASLAGVETLTNKTINLGGNTLVATSAQLAAALTDETGTGAAVFAGSPALTGTPTAPTATFGTDTTQIATTAFVQDVVTNPAFSAYQSTLQSVPNATFTKIQFQTEEFDTNSNFDSTTNYRFTPTVAGYYLITGALTFDSSSALVTVSIYKNGADFKRGNISGSAANSGLGSNVSTIVFLNGSTDYVELFGFQGSGGALNTDAQAARTYFQAHWARAS